MCNERARDGNTWLFIGCKGACAFLTYQNTLAFGKWWAWYKLSFRVKAIISAVMPATRWIVAYSWNIRV